MSENTQVEQHTIRQEQYRGNNSIVFEREFLVSSPKTYTVELPLIGKIVFTAQENVKLRQVVRIIGDEKFVNTQLSRVENAFKQLGSGS